MTKDSGRAGGFQEKVEAARENGTRVVVIRRPKENGISLEEAMEAVSYTHLKWVYRRNEDERT